MQVSLDLEKAFDAIDRDLVFRALHLFNLDPDLRCLVHSWLLKYEYCVPHKDLLGRFTASKGIKQRSKDAPMLWTLSIYLILHDLARYDMHWIISHIIIYVDDIHLKWIINSVTVGFKALHDLQCVVRTLKAYHFQVNECKSGTIMRLVGKSAQAFLNRWISRSKEGPQLHLPDTALSLPLVSKTNYLGIIISYKVFANDTVTRRVTTAANVCFRVLRQWFMDSYHPFHVRVSLYNQCVLPTVSYGVHEMGITAKGFHQIISMIHRHYRTMARSPIHIIRESTHAFYTRLNLQRPWHFLQLQQFRLTHTLSRRRIDLTQLAMQTCSQDICVLIPDYPDNHITVLLKPMIRVPRHLN